MTTDDKEPQWLPLEVVKALNEARTSEMGGDAEVCDACALQTALARPLDAHAYGERDIFTLAAIYGAGVAVRNPFSSANRETAWAAVETFLSENGVRIDASKAEIDAVLTALTSGEIGEIGFAETLRSMAA